MIFVSVLRERYLRDDVSCGIENCTACDCNQGLPASGDKTHSAFPEGHFIIPDTNVFLSQVSIFSYQSPVLLICEHFQMDLMESDLFTTPIILLQTVMEEVRHRSMPLYNRLKALTIMDGKQIWVFYNEYRS